MPHLLRVYARHTELGQQDAGQCQALWLLRSPARTAVDRASLGKCVCCLPSDCCSGEEPVVVSVT